MGGDFMRIRDYIIIGAAFCAALLVIVGGLVAQDTLTWEGILPSIFTGTSGTDSINVTIASTNTDFTVTEDLTVGGWSYYPPVTVAAQSYTIASTGKARVYIHEYTDTEASTIFLPDTPTDGLILTIVDGDQNATSNNLVIETEGSDTINEGSNFTLDTDEESTTVIYDSGNTNWQIIGGYLE
jgi:hypothetical protein